MRGTAGFAALFLGVGTILVLFIMSSPGPRVAITSPQDGATVTGMVTITGTASAAGASLTGVQVRIDAGDWMMATDLSGDDGWSTWSVSWDTRTSLDGSHHVVATARDGSDAETETSIAVQVVNPPWVRILAPENGTTEGGILVIQGEAGDPTANDTVERVQVAIDPTPGGGDWQDAIPTVEDWTRWSFAWNTTPVSVGWHSVVARAFDGDLYSEPWANEYFIDNRPFVQFVHPRMNPMPPESVEGVVLVHGTAGDLDVNDRVELVQVRIDDGAWRDATDASPDGTWSVWAYQWNSSETGDGERELCVRAWDGSLYSESVCGRVFVANGCSRPTVVIEEPEEEATVKGLVLVHGRAQDSCCVLLVQVRFGDGPWTNATDTSPDGTWATWALGWDTTPRPDGCLKVYARAWDGILFSVNDTIRVCVDNRDAQPTVALENLAEGETLGGLRLLHGSTGGTTGVQLVQIQVDDGPWENAVDTGRVGAWSTWAYEWNTTAIPNGAHQVCARSVDGQIDSEPACVLVTVYNLQDGSSTEAYLEASLRKLGAPSWLASESYLLLLFFPSVGGVVVWMRYKGYLG